MLNKEEYITEELPPDLFKVGNKYANMKKEIAAIKREIRFAYGLSFEEFAKTRNKMLIENNGKLLLKDFHNLLINKILIDLVGKGYLELNKNIVVNQEMKFALTDKAFSKLEKSNRYCKEKNPFKRLLLHRNYGLLNKDET